MLDVAGIILAAGSSTRMGTNKLLMEFKGKPIIRHVAEAACLSKINSILVVTGPERHSVKAALTGLNVTFVHNENYMNGMAGSLKTGIACLSEKALGAIVLLGDMPLISAKTLNKIVESFKANQDSLAVIPSFDGKRGNPVLISRSLFEDVMKITGDKGARQLLDTLGNQAIELPLNDKGISLDVDTREGFEALSAS